MASPFWIMRSEWIPYAKTGYFNRIITDYLAGDDALRPFYVHDISKDAFDPAIREKQGENIDRNLLADILQQQYEGFETDVQVRRHIEDLRDVNTWCLVTAHQLNICTGPLYVIYKILSTINICGQLEKVYTGKKFIPVFWLGSEDHDFDEINHVHIGEKTFVWEDRQGGPCGIYDPHSVLPLIDAIEKETGDSVYGAELFALFRDAYGKRDTLAQATRHILNGLFGRFGLLIVDGNATAFKKACLDMIRDELLQQGTWSAMQKTDEELSKKYSLQVHPREINLFYMGKGFRERIVFDVQKNTYSVLNTDLIFSKEEILAEAEAHPGSFSPNVLLRPLFQQRVLPSLAYTGGGGELAYWLQLLPVFKRHKIAFPVLLLRNSVLWIDAKIGKKIGKLRLEGTSLFLHSDRIMKEYILRHFRDEVDLGKAKEQISKLFDGILVHATEIDPTLERTVLGQRQKASRSIEMLENKLVRARKRKSGHVLVQIAAIREQLFPHDMLQERYCNAIPWYAALGPAWIDSLLSLCDPLQKAFLVLTENAS